MKIKFIIGALAVILISLAACAQKKANENISERQSRKVLVAYFSATGNTRHAAEDLAKVMGGTLHEITPEKVYSDADLDWRDSTSRCYVEMHDLEYRPPITDKVENMDKYDTVFVGFPIWWYIAPTIINTFIENNDLEGKTVVCFATSGGSPIGPCVEALKKQYPNINWTDGKLLNGASREDMKKWKEYLGL